MSRLGMRRLGFFGLFAEQWIHVFGAIVSGLLVDVQVVVDEQRLRQNVKVQQEWRWRKRLIP